MPDLKTGKDCCGCTACASICPHSAIAMEPDDLGFLYPKVDYSKCVECKLCEEVCAFNDHYDIKDNFKTPETWGVRLKNTNEMMKSRSGGAFVAFSDWILEHGGVVYGVGFKDHFRVVHKRATTAEERNEFRGSKYVQSDLRGVFRQIRKDLLEGNKVMFVGTGCQTSAIKSYLPKKLQENLWVVDIVCHGVPSPYIWKDYLEYMEISRGEKIIKVNFRDKEKFGWTAHKESYEFEDGETITSDAFTYLFYKHILLRESCGNCHFCNVRRASDLTLADFWGWQRTGSKINEDDKGLSLILINTEKGKRLFEDTKDRLNIVHATLEQSMQGHLEHPTELNHLSEKFKKDYIAHGFTYVLKKYGNQSWQYKIKNSIRIVLSVPKRIVKKLIRLSR